MITVFLNSMMPIEIKLSLCAGPAHGWPASAFCHSSCLFLVSPCSVVDPSAACCPVHDSTTTADTSATAGRTAQVDPHPRRFRSVAAPARTSVRQPDAEPETLCTRRPDDRAAAGRWPICR